MYIEGLAVPYTINAIPEKTLLAFEDHGQVKGLMPREGGDAEQVLAEFSRAGINDAVLAAQLQYEGIEAFDKSWNDLMECIASKSQLLRKRGSRVSRQGSAFPSSVAEVITLDTDRFVSLYDRFI